MYGWVKRREKERELYERKTWALVGWLVRVGWQNRSGMSSTNYIAVRNERNPFAAREAYKQIRAIRISSRVEYSRNAANTRRIRERRVRICSLVRVARSGTSLLNVSERFDRDREGRGAYSRESADGWEKERKRSPVCDKSFVNTSLVVWWRLKNRVLRERRREYYAPAVSKGCTRTTHMDQSAQCLFVLNAPFDLRDASG